MTSVIINEFLPNPKGKDTEGEWIELFNGNATSVNTEGWKLTTAHSKKSYVLHGSMGAGEHLLLPRSRTKLTLANTTEEVFLYNAAGARVDHVVMNVQAPEGKSFSRLGAQFVFSQPTPGTQNISVAATSSIHFWQETVVSTQSLTLWSATSLSLAVALCITAAILFILKSTYATSHLLFERNAAPRQPGE